MWITALNVSIDDDAHAIVAKNIVDHGQHEDYLIVGVTRLHENDSRNQGLFAMKDQTNNPSPGCLENLSIKAGPSRVSVQTTSLASG